MRFGLAALSFLSRGLSSNADENFTSENQHGNNGRYADLLRDEKKPAFPSSARTTSKGARHPANEVIQDAKESGELRNSDLIFNKYDLATDDSNEFEVCGIQLGVLNDKCSSPDDVCVPFSYLVGDYPIVELTNYEKIELGICLHESVLDGSAFDTMFYHHDTRELTEDTCDSECGGDRPVIEENGEDFRKLIADCLAGSCSVDAELKCWDVSKVTDMGLAFYGQKNFDQSLDCWKTDNVEYMNGMFAFAQEFNQPIGNWNTEKVKDMSGMFYLAQSFDQPIGDWNTQKVTDMYAMFAIARSFDQPIEKWDTSSVTDMASMFFALLFGRKFNQPLDAWDVANVVYMESMFSGAGDFDQCLGTWASKTSDDVYVAYMFYGSGCSNGYDDPKPGVGPWCQGSAESCFDPYACADETESFVFKGETYTCQGLSELSGSKRNKLCKSKTGLEQCPGVCNNRCTCQDKTKFKIKKSANGDFKGSFKCKDVGKEGKPVCATTVKKGVLVRDECPSQCDYCLSATP